MSKTRGTASMQREIDYWLEFMPDPEKVFEPIKKALVANVRNAVEKLPAKIKKVQSQNGLCRSVLKRF